MSDRLLTGGSRKPLIFLEGPAIIGAPLRKDQG